jgi:hypothetical protein
VSHPISATFLAISSLLVLVQLFAYFRKIRITPPPGQTGAWMTR